MKGIIFDIGNVIQPVTWEDSARTLAVPKDKYKTAFMKDRECYFDFYERGELSSTAFARYVLSNLGIEATTENQDLFQESVRYLWGEPDLRLIHLIRNISPKVKKAILSNSCPELEERIRSFGGTERGYLHLFEPHVFLSHHIGTKKPEKRAYEIVVESLGLTPAECCFIDDKAENVESAKAIGLQVVLYENADQIEDLLRLSKII